MIKPLNQSRTIFFKLHLLFKRKIPFYKPWAWYWWLFFGPWTWSFRFMSFFIPKKKGMVLFGSNEGRLYSDNSRALFEHIQKNPTHLQAIWLTNNPDVYRQVHTVYPGSVVMAPSIKSAYYYLRSEQIFLSFGWQDMCKMPWIPSKYVNQLWHGIPLKKIGLLKFKSELKKDYGKTVDLFLRSSKNVNRFFVASEYEKKTHTAAFGLSDDKFKLTGNPRNDHLYDMSQKKKPTDQTILYTPTFRERRGGSGNHSQVLMHPEINEEQMHNFLVENNANLIIRPHWITDPPVFSSERISCVTHDEEPDLHQLFKQADILVTDYSSAYIDWLILDRPVIFSPYDLQNYTLKNGLLEDYTELVPSPICHTSTELFSSLSEALENPSAHAIQRELMKQKYLGDLGGNACERILEIMTQEP
ncbi:MAG: hypothetical protein CMA64_05670 [Euryarchaeota archaeon]|nr:hypothetical protein [Euryarchaeota archaeon]